MQLIPQRLARADRGLVTVIALAFATSLGDAAIIPVLPEIRDGFGLSGIETGMLLSATTLAMLAAAVPVGLLAGRLGTRRLLLTSAVLLPLSMLGQALAPGLGALLAARMVFGLSFGILWTIGPALAAGGGRGAAGTGKLIAASGAGWLVGPVFAGVVSDLLGYRIPFFVIAALCVPLAVVLACDRSVAPSAPAARLRDAVAAARSEPALGGATLVTALLGVVTGVSGLVAPLVLSNNGLSAGAIGAAIALSAVVWIVGGALATRLPSASIDVRLVGVAAALLAVAWLIPVVSLSTIAVVCFLVCSAACRAVLNTVVYALARLNVPSEALAAPIVGVMNVAWAAMALSAPIAAGLAVSGVGARWAFMATALAGFGVAAWMLMPRRYPVAAAV
jgi:MFS transporter, DHA1 family, inner membrane transport protein